MAVVTLLQHHAKLPTPDGKPKRPSFDSRIFFLLIAVSALYPLMLITPLKTRFQTISPPALQPQSLTLITLIYKQDSSHRNIAHNCRIISPTRHRFIVFTDDITQPYCHVCQCRLFVKANCPCPDGTCRLKNPCEKLLFLTSSLIHFQEIVLLDNDLLILRPDFLEHLSIRSRAHDFLATYGHGTMNSSYSYYRNFNSGLLFMRWKPNLDYTNMKKLMYNSNSTTDQAIISRFVQNNYNNWDVLSWKWHCRSLERMHQDIPLSQCYTVHDRQEVDSILTNLNRTRLTIP